MDTTLRFPPVDPSTYAWEPMSHDPCQWRRRTLGTEGLWIARPKEYHEMFIGGALTLDTVAHPFVVVRAAKAAWRRLRFDVPEVAVRAGYGADGQAYLHYEAPISEPEVKEWVERTSCFEYGKKSMGFQELLDDMRQKKRGRESEQVFLLLHFMEESEDLVERVAFILNADHQITDGIGIRILLGRFLALLAESLSLPHVLEKQLDWHQSVNNLSPPWVDVVNEEQAFSGPDYERMAEANYEFLFHKMPQNPGIPLLPLLSPSKPPIQKTHFRSLSSTQTTSLLHAIKHLISPSSTITHLGHASMVLALLRSNPLPPASSPRKTETLYSACWLNGRRYLAPSPAHPHLVKSYVPPCQSFAPIQFPGLDELVLEAAAPKDEVREVLLKACRIATGEYGRIRERRSMLPECVVVFERLARNLLLKQEELRKGEKEQGTPSSSEPTVTADDGSELVSKGPVSPNGQQGQLVQTADPFFLSDGVTEQYIDRAYTDHTSQRVFEVDQLRFAANAEKNLIVRMSSWRGRVTVSGEWKECDYDGEMVVRYLEDVVGIMLSLLD